MSAAPQSSRTDFVFMLVSLFFILISFFIVISTMSVRDNEKLQSAVDSITQTFKVSDRLAVVTKQLEPDSYTVFLGDLQGWIGNLYALGDVSIERRGSLVAVTVRQPNLFEEDSVKFTPQGLKAMQALADLLLTWQTDYLTELDVIANEPTEYVPGAVGNFVGATHGGAMGAFLLQRGIAPHMLAVGMKNNPERELSFTFTVRVPPKINQVPESREKKTP